MSDSLFSNDPLPEDDLFTDTPAPEEFIKTTAKNIIPDLGNTALGIGQQLKTGLYDIPKAILKAPQTVARTGMELSDGVPLSETTLNQERPEWSKQPLETGKAMIEPLVHPVDYFEKHPVQQTLNVLGLVGGVKALEGENPALPEIQKETPSLPPETSSEGSQGLRPETQKIPPPEASAPRPDSAIARDPLINDALTKAKEVKDYISKTYENAAAKPGFAPELADLAQEKSQMMAVKAAGGSPLFATQGIRAGKTPIQINNELRAIGQYMLDNDIVKPELGNKLMLQTQEAIQNAAGEKIGAIREMADKLRHPAETPVDVLQEIHKRLGNDYEPGMPGSQEYQTALKIVEKSEPTFSGAAEAATKLNKLANKANRNFQPHTAYTDVANAISDINNERIKDLVGPKLATDYEQALREFGVNKKIQNMLGRKVGQNLHRTGPGSLTRAAYQKFMDEVGYKGGAKVMNRMAGQIKNNPAMAKSLPSLFKSFINDVEDILPEKEGMAHGGIVKPDIDQEIHHHLRKQFDPEYAKAMEGC